MRATRSIESRSGRPRQRRQSCEDRDVKPMATGARRRGIELRRLAAALALSLWAGAALGLTVPQPGRRGRRVRWDGIGLLAGEMDYCANRINIYIDNITRLCYDANGNRSIMPTRRPGMAPSAMPGGCRFPADNSENSGKGTPGLGLGFIVQQQGNPMGAQTGLAYSPWFVARDRAGEVMRMTTAGMYALSYRRWRGGRTPRSLGLGAGQAIQ